MKCFPIVAFLILIIFGACHSSKKSTSPDREVLIGDWLVNFVSTSSTKSFADLYPNGYPTLSFDNQANRVSGYSGCNNFNGSFLVNGDEFAFHEEMAVTPKACFNGKEGEQAFYQALKQVNHWRMTDDKNLELLSGKIMVLKLSRK